MASNILLTSKDKVGTTIKNLLVSPKDKDPMVNSKSVPYTGTNVVT